MRCLMFALVMGAVLAIAIAQDAEKGVEEAKPTSAPAAAAPHRDAGGNPLATLHLPSSLNIPNNLVGTLAIAGAVVVGLVGAAAVLALVLPLFGIRLCYLFGTCETSYAHAFLAPTAYDAYAYSQPVYTSAAYAKSYDGVTNELPYAAYEAYQPQVLTYPTTNSLGSGSPATAATATGTTSNAYQKRSLEYVGPILKLLSNAYEKYNHPAHSKSVEKSSASVAAESKTQ